MKRFLKVLLSLCFVFCLLPSYALAANSTYELDELGMSIELPSDYVVFTRDIKSNDPNLRTFGLTKDEMSSLMQERSIYLNAWDKDLNYEIIVTMIESPFEDYNQFSDTSLSLFVSALEPEYAGMGITLLRSKFYQHSQAKFAKLYISQPDNGETVYGLQYHTVYDGKAINITLQSYSGTIDSAKESILKEIVDSVCFGTEPQLNPPPVQTKAFTHTDTNSGMTFTVPANWVETPMNKEREYIDAKFTSNLDDGLCIIFMSEDLYESEEFKEEFSATEKLLLTRDMVGNDLFTKADIAEMCGCKEKDVSLVTYGGKEYYSAEVVTSSTAYGLTVSTPMVFLVRCENSYMYMFQFNGAKDNPYFADFEKLVSSVKYPDFENTETVRDQILGAYFLLAIIVLIALVLIIVFVCRSAIKKKSTQKNPQDSPIITEEDSAKTAPEVPQEKAEEVIPPTPQTKEPVTEPEPAAKPLTKKSESAGSRPASFCHRCGNKLLSGSLFCNQCGAKIPTTDE